MMIKNQKPLLYDDKDNTYYYLDYPACNKCDTIIVEPFGLIYYYNKHHNKINIDIKEYCIKCYQEESKKEGFDILREEMIVIPVTKRPINALPVVFVPNSLSPRKNMDCFMATSLESEKTINRTKWAGRDILSKMNITSRDMPEIGSELPPEKEIRDIELFLNEHKTGIPILPDDKKKLLK